MKTYNEMDKEIIKLLDMEGMPLSVYAARYIEKLQAEVIELREKLDKAAELQFNNGDEAYAIIDTLLYTDAIPVTIKSADVVYEVFDGEQTTIQHRTRIFATRAEAEARLKELQGDNND